MFSFQEVDEVLYKYEQKVMIYDGGRDSIFCVESLFSEVEKDEREQKMQRVRKRERERERAKWVGYIYLYV